MAGMYIFVGAYKESAMVGTFRALSNFIKDDDGVFKRTIVKPVYDVLKSALETFDEDGDFDSPCVVEVYDTDHYRVELVYFNEPENRYYIRFEWL